MAHSHHAHREHQVSHRRVHEILKGEPEGAKHHAKSHAFSKVTSKTAAEHHDKKVAGHKGAKRYARGGKVKGKGHQTNIAIVVPHHPAAPPMPSSAAGLPAGPAAAPPMAGPGLPPPGGAPGMPPGMPMRKHGGRIRHRADGGIAGRLSDAADDAKQDVTGAMRAGAADISNDPKKAGSAGPYLARQRLRGDMSMPMRASGGKVIDGESTKADIKKWSKHASDNSYFRGGAASGVGREEKAAHMKRKGK